MTVAIASLWLRDLRRFFRQRSRVFGAVAQPILFWVLMGSGLGGVMKGVGTNGPNAVEGAPGGYFRYLYPGIVVMVLLFSAIFATISVIEDRREGFLKSVLVAPLPRASVVLAKALGCATIAFLEGAVLLALAPIAGFSLGPTQLLLAAWILFVLAFALSALGLAIAWSMDSTQGFHVIMNFFLLPMWFLSGAFFPTAGAPGWLVWMMRVDPLTYGVSAFRMVLSGLHGVGPEAPSLSVSLTATVVFAAVTFGAAIVSAERKPAGGIL